MSTSRVCESYDNLPYINKKVYNFICESGMTHLEFANRIGMTQQSISRLFRQKEDGSFPKVTKQIRECMTQAFNLPIDWFVAEVEDNPDDAPKGTDMKSTSVRMQYLKDYLINTGRITSLFDLSRKMKVARGFLPLLFDGRMQVTSDFVNSLNSTFDNIFNASWILTGEGKMLSEVDDSQLIIKKLKTEIEDLRKQLQEAAMEIIKLNGEIRALKG